MLWGRDWLQVTEKKSMESQARLMSWYWKRKPTWKKDLITYNIYPRIMFPFNWLIIICRGVGEGRARLKLDVQGQVGGRILDVAWTVGVGFRQNWTIYMGVICVSSLTCIKKFWSHYLKTLVIPIVLWIIVPKSFWISCLSKGTLIWWFLKRSWFAFYHI